MTSRHTHITHKSPQMLHTHTPHTPKLVILYPSANQAHSCLPFPGRPHCRLVGAPACQARHAGRKLQTTKSQLNTVSGRVVLILVRPAQLALHALSLSFSRSSPLSFACLALKFEVVALFFIPPPVFVAVCARVATCREWRLSSRRGGGARGRSHHTPYSRKFPARRRPVYP